MSDKTPQPKSIIANFNSALNQRADQLGVFVEKNGKNLVVVFIAFLVICGLFFAYSFYNHTVAVKKFDEAYALDQKIAGFVISDTDTSEKIKAKKTPETDGVEFNQIHTDVVAFIKDNASNEASRNLALRWSSYLYGVDQFDKSLEVLNSLNLKNKSSLDALTVLAKASTSVQLGKLTEAIDLYKKIISNKSWGYVHPEARFQMSLALIENKNESEALENLKTILTEYPKERKTVEEATKIIRWLTFKNNKDK